MSADSFGARSTIEAGGRELEIFRLDALQARYDVARLPFSLKILLENLLRHEGDGAVTAADIEALARWDARARAGAAAGKQNLEWNFTDLFYYNQGQENSGYVTDEFIDSLYEAAGVDAAKANAFRKTDAAAAPAKEADAEAQKYGIQSTPSFVVGPTGGPYTKLDVDISNPDGFKAALNSLLKK